MTQQMRVPRVLAIDDDTFWLSQLPEILHGLADVTGESNIDDAFSKLEAECFDIVLLDLNFPGEIRSGVDVFKQIFALNKSIDVIVISGETDPLRIVEVCNAGVSRFIPKPANIEQIRSEVFHVISKRQEQLDAFINTGTNDLINPLIGTSPAMNRLREQVQEVLKIGFKDLLIEGETGTGKEIMAQYLFSHLAPGTKMIPLHCGAIADGIAESELFGHVKGAFTGADRDRVGVFEAAAGGFVFLDEIGEMPLTQQAKLLRVIQERKVQRVGSFEQRLASFRTISATNIDLEKAVKEKRFREDLYFRISKEKITIPPLRDRQEDIPLIIKSLNLRNSKGEPVEFTDSAMSLLMNHDWPGNLRQLTAICEGIAARSNTLILRDRDVSAVLPELSFTRTAGITRGTLASYASAVALAKRKKFEKALVQAKGNREDAARALGLSRATYFRRARDLGLIGLRLPNLQK